MATHPTPTKVGSKIDSILDHLNAHWDLGLPRLHGPENLQVPDNDWPVECFYRIRYLCFRTDAIDSAITVFEEQAKYIQSKWTFKPSQERGTLPIYPVSKSTISRDLNLRRRQGVFSLTDSQRRDLLKCLHKVLVEYCGLSELSESFSTEQASTSTTSFTTAPRSVVRPTTPTKQTVCRVSQRYTTASRNVLKVSESAKVEVDEPQLKNPKTKSSKRSLSSSAGQNKRHQVTLSQIEFLIPKAPQTPSTLQLPTTDPSRAPLQTSFETVPSAGASAVFSSPGNDDEDLTSVATSMLSTQAEDSQDLFPTQDANAIFEDEDFQKSFHDSCLPPAAFDVTNLAQNTPFKQQAMLPPGLPFWYCWEVQRAATNLGLLPIELNMRIKKAFKKNDVTYDEFWTYIKQLSSELKKDIPQKSSLPHWLTHDNRYEDQKTNKVVYLTAALDWEDDPSRSLFKLRLSPPSLETSCRFYRKFGADRFLVLSVPSPDESNFPAKVKRLAKAQGPPLGEKITNFLAENEHYIAGRYWRVCNIDEEKSKSSTRKEEPRRIKITLFAIKGYGISEITLKHLLAWHLLLDANLTSTDLKLFSRLGLGFTKTRPTITLKPYEFLFRRNPPTGEVMDDGCALMSFPLARAIWESYGGKGEPPSVVQGRISGAKGLWIVDYQGRFDNVSERGYWIQVSDSQLKIKPHPHDRPDADVYQRTFEVLKYWGECREGHLNKQLVTILEDRGVPRELLQETLERDLSGYSTSLISAMNDPNPDSLRLWMQEYGLNSRAGGGKMLGSFPDSKKTQLKVLLESGFVSRECEKVWSLTGDLHSAHMADYLEKMRIRLENSTVVFCAPDPCGVLAEDEVFLSFSRPVTDPRTGLAESALDGTDVLLARNPAYLESDMQKRRAVYKHKLRHYKDVILFSTRGKVPTAALLSGGDYDGDTVTVIWNPQFTSQFVNVTEAPKLDEADCGLQNKSRELSDIFWQGRDRNDAIQDFLRGCIAFNARSTMLGMCSNEHERLIYNLSLKEQQNKLATPGAIKLAALSGFLVDSRKQGWELASTKWNLLRREACGKMGLPDPAYKTDQEPKKLSNTHTNVLDYLKFDVAQGLSEQAKETFARQKSDVGNYDTDLVRFWKEASSSMDREEEETKRAAAASSSRHNLRHSHLPSTRLSEMLKGEAGLLTQLQQLMKLWSTYAMSGVVSSPTGDTRENKGFEQRIQAIFEAYTAIEPPRLNHELRRQYDREVALNHAIPHWSLLKASCLYASVVKSGARPGWVWYVAGRELCVLKTLHTTGQPKVLPAHVYESLKFDTKFVKASIEKARSQLFVDDGRFVETMNDVDDDDDDDATVALD